MTENPPFKATKAGDWLSGLEFFGIKLGLDQTRELFRLAGNPQDGLKFIHVAGSNGKGSICALLDSALRSAGFNTGFYSSPHLVDPRERLRVDGRLPSPAEFDALLAEARLHVETMRAAGAQPTYFEVTTLLAALRFAKEKVDFVLWETGMGGRLDSTNIVEPVCSIISGISMEHADRLGDSLAKIAFEKAGIIKPGRPVFCARLQDEAMAVVEKRAKALSAPLTLCPADLGAPSFALSSDGSFLQRFRVDGRDLNVSLPGLRQRDNAALCLEVLKWLSSEYVFPLDAALEGFAKAKWPARMQFLSERRTIIDGAHNPEAAEVLASTLEELFPAERFQVVVGSFKDKDSRAVLGSLARIASEFVFVPVDSTRPSRSPAELSALLATGAPHREASSLAEALKEAPPSGMRRLICGSLHLCGEALAFFGEDSDKALET